MYPNYKTLKEKKERNDDENATIKYIDKSKEQLTTVCKNYDKGAKEFTAIIDNALNSNS